MTAVNTERLLFFGRQRPLRVETVSLSYGEAVGCAVPVGSRNDMAAVPSPAATRARESRSAQQPLRGIQREYQRNRQLTRGAAKRLYP